MPNTPTKILFMSTLMGSTLISISANSWLGAWMGLEINLLSFIPIMTNSKNLSSTEASLKYFLVQALASATLLFSIIFMYMMSDMLPSMDNKILLSLISLSILMKMGAAPFHFWFPGVMEGLSWINCLILMTWQKIAPLMLLTYCINFNIFTAFIIISSVMIGSLGGLNQTSLRKIMAYSSINHLGWMISAMVTGENLWLIYFSIYTFLSISLISLFNLFQIFHINQTFAFMNNKILMKFIMMTFLLSLGGLPPFLGFLPKWMVIQTLTEQDIIFTSVIMVIMTLITLFYYLRISFSSILLSYTEFKWNYKTFSKNSPSMFTMILSTFSILGLSTCSIMFNML